MADLKTEKSDRLKKPSNSTAPDVRQHKMNRLADRWPANLIQPLPHGSDRTRTACQSTAHGRTSWFHSLATGLPVWPLSTANRLACKKRQQEINGVASPVSSAADAAATGAVRRVFQTPSQQTGHDMFRKKKEEFQSFSFIGFWARKFWLVARASGAAGQADHRPALPDVVNKKQNTGLSESVAFSPLLVVLSIAPLRPSVGAFSILRLRRLEMPPSQPPTGPTPMARGGLLLSLSLSLQPPELLVH